MLLKESNLKPCKYKYSLKKLPLLWDKKRGFKTTFEWPTKAIFKRMQPEGLKMTKFVTMCSERTSEDDLAQIHLSDGTVSPKFKFNCEESRQVSFPLDAPRLQRLMRDRKEEGDRDDYCQQFTNQSYLYFYDKHNRKIDRVRIKRTSFNIKEQSIAENEEIIGYHGGVFDSKATVQDYEYD